MKLRKGFDSKSALIGAAIAVATVLGMGATSTDDKDKWDKFQDWEVREAFHENGLVKWKSTGNTVGREGYEPFAVDNGKIYLRKRTN